MAVVKDWARDVAIDIEEQQGLLGDGDTLSIEQIVEIIENHCPYRRGFVYEEVGENAILRKLNDMARQIQTIRRAI